MDEPEVLRAAAHLRLDAGLLQRLLERSLHLQDLALALLATLLDLLPERVVLFGLQKLEGQWCSSVRTPVTLRESFWKTRGAVRSGATARHPLRTSPEVSQLIAGAVRVCRGGCCS